MRSTSTLAVCSLSLLAALSGPACGGAADDLAADTSSEAVSAPSVDPGRVRSAIAKLDALRNGDTIGRYYEDGDRVEGCWRNPAGNKLTELKKAFYCSMPLEFRLCNTVVLLTVNESKVAERYAGYLACQTRVDAAFGGGGMFVFDDEIDGVYRDLYLRGGTLPAADQADVIAAAKPPYSSRSFARVLVAIGASIAREASALAIDDLGAMADDFRTRGGLEPR